MSINWTRRLLTMIAVTGGILGAATLPAVAAPATTPRIGMIVQAPFDLNNLTFVAYHSRHASAKVFGNVSAATAGEVVRLFAQQFPYNKPAVQTGIPVTLSRSGTVGYSFSKLTPVLATRYQAELFADGNATTPLASSKVMTVYVAKGTPITQSRRCPRPNCVFVVHVKVLLPAQAMRAERTKKVYTYFAVNLSPSHIPPPPSLLKLGAGHPRVTRPRKISAGAYALSITFTFRIGNDAAHWGFNFCTKDTEAADGLGLPGHHRCGATRIPAGIYYLG
jgi:hypothetical protein